MTMPPLSALNRYAEALLSTTFVPWWEVYPERIKPTPTASAEALAAAYCEESPTKRHIWWIEEHTATCRHCKEVRETLEAKAPYNYGNSSVGRPASNFNVSMKERLCSMSVGERAVIEHRHLQCLYYQSGGIRRCGLLRAVSRLRLAHRGIKDWAVEHREPFVGVVRRIL